MEIDKAPSETPPAKNMPTEFLFAGPAFHINQMYIGLDEALCRLTFCEENPDTKVPYFRTAVILSRTGINHLMEMLIMFNQVMAQREAEANSMRQQLVERNKETPQ